MKKTIFMLLVLMATFAAHAQTYLYEEQDGTRWITNQKLKSKNFTFLEQYGRPTAVSSCRGVSEAAIMERAKKHMPHVYKYAHKFKIDPMLVKALIRAESCFDHRAISRAGAHGIMQFMPATARDYGVLDRFDAYSSIKGGVEHLRDLLNRFKGSKTKAIAAYNAGAGAVTRYKGIPPYKETQTYVRRVLNFYEKYQSQHIADVKKNNPRKLVVKKLSP